MNTQLPKSENRKATNGGPVFGFRFSIFVLLTLLAAAVPLRGTTVTGAIQLPDGTPVNGTLEFILSQRATTTTPPILYVPEKTTCAITAGAIAAGCTIQSNDALDPAGTFYRVRILDANNRALGPTVKYTLSGGTVDLGSLPVTVTATLVPPDGSVTGNLNVTGNLTVGGSADFGADPQEFDHLRLRNQTADPATVTDGSLWHRSDLDRVRFQVRGLQLYDGSQFVDITAGTNSIDIGGDLKVGGGTNLGGFADLKCSSEPTAPGGNATRLYCLSSDQQYFFKDSGGVPFGPLASLNRTANWTAAQNFKTANNIRFADQFPGADAGAKIQAALTDLPAAGGVVDARGLEGAQNLATSLTVDKPVRLLLGAVTLAQSAPVVIASDDVTIEGVPGQTLLQQSAPDIDLIRLADGADRIVLRGLTLDGQALGSEVGYKSVNPGTANRGLVLCEKTHVTGSAQILVEQVEIRSFRNQGLYLGGPCTDITLQDFYIHDIGDRSDFSLTGGEGISLGLGDGSPTPATILERVVVRRGLIERGQNTLLSISGIHDSTFADLWLTDASIGIQAGNLVDRITIQRARIWDIGFNADELSDVAIGIGFRKSVTHSKILDSWISDVRDDVDVGTPPSGVGYCLWNQEFTDADESFDNEIAGNLLSDCPSAGILVQGQPGTRVLRNEVFASGSQGVPLWVKAGTAGHVLSRLTLAGNYLHDNLGTHSLRLDGTNEDISDALVVDNIIDNNAGHGISLKRVRRSTLARNLIRNNDNDDSGQDGMLIFDNSSDNLIAHNAFSCDSPGGPNCHQYHVNISQVTPTRNRFEFNAFLSNARLGDINDVGASGNSWITSDATADRLDVGALRIGAGFSGDGGGFKHQRAATGSIAPGQSAAVTLAWPTPFADTDYTVNCTLEQPTASTLALRLHHVEDKTAAAVTLRIVNDDGDAPHSGTLHCTAIHD
jgi:parallel beta-helix repeat protein